MKNNKNRYAFFLDIDGTLMIDNVICAENRAAIAKAQKAGHLFFLNTARGMSIFPPVALTVKPDGIITSIGSCITVGNDDIFNKTIPVKEFADLLDRFNERGLPLVIEGYSAFIRNRFVDIPEAVCVRDSRELLARFGNRTMAKGYCPCVMPEDLAQELKEKYNYYYHSGYAEFAVKGCSKGTAVKYLADRYSVDIKHTVAMGDSLNDLDMLSAAGISVAMGDGEEEIKKLCNIVTCPAAQGGVAQAIYEITGIKP